MVPTKPVRGKTIQPAIEKSENGFKIYSDVSSRSEPTSSSLLEDTKMLLQVQWLPFENEQSPFYVVNEVTLTGQKPSLKFC